MYSNNSYEAIATMERQRTGNYGADYDDERRVVYTCSRCDGDIYEGDEFVDFGSQKICIDCINESNPTEILLMCGFGFERAEYIPPYDD